MRERLGFPFRRISRDGPVVAGQWFLQGLEKGEQALGNEIPGWDYKSNFGLARDVHIDVDGCLQDTGLDNTDARLAFLIQLETGPTGSRWTVCRHDLPEEGVWKKRISFDVLSEQLTGKLTVTSQIVLASIKDPEKRPLVARYPGSRLWQEQKEIALEGTLGRFPMESVDLAGFLGDPRMKGARWYLSWSPTRPDSSFLGNVRLYLNSENLAFMELVHENDPMVISLIAGDVLRQMCGQMIASEDFVNGAEDFEDESVGGVVRGWLDTAFGGMKLHDIRAWQEQDPARFEATIQAVFGG